MNLSVIKQETLNCFFEKKLFKLFIIIIRKILTKIFPYLTVCFDINFIKTDKLCNIFQHFEDNFQQITGKKHGKK